MINAERRSLTHTLAKYAKCRLDPSAVLSTDLPLSNAARSLLKTFCVWRIRLRNRYERPIPPKTAWGICTVGQEMRNPLNGNDLEPTTSAFAEATVDRDFTDFTDQKRQFIAKSLPIRNRDKDAKAEKTLAVESNEQVVI
jgi:hypothetical protein